MIAGDFYNLDGKKIGTDGLSDGQIHLVYDQNEAKSIEKTKGAYTGTVTSKVTLPNADVVTAISDAVATSNNAGFTGKLGENETASGGFSETAVTWKTTGGKTEITTSMGSEVDPRTKGIAEVSSPSDVDGRAHIHPSGEIVTTTTTGKPCPPGSFCTGNSQTSTQRANFTQPPVQTLGNGDPGDIPKASPGKVNIVVAARTERVYFYNRSGIYAEMKLSNFKKLGK